MQEHEKLRMLKACINDWISDNMGTGVIFEVTLEAIHEKLKDKHNPEWLNKMLTMEASAIREMLKFRHCSRCMEYLGKGSGIETDMGTVICDKCALDDLNCEASA